MVSLKAKNPFAGGDIDLGNLKTLMGIGLFAVLTAGFVTVVMIIKPSADRIGGAAGSLVDKYYG